MKHVRVATEDVADGLRVGKHHEVAVAGDVEREGVAHLKHVNRGPASSSPPNSMGSLNQDSSVVARYRLALSLRIEMKSSVLM